MENLGALSILIAFCLAVFAIAASLAAGLSGIEEGLTPTEPIVGNGYDQGGDVVECA